MYKKILPPLFVFLILFNTISLAQYYGERNTEQSFEQSDLFFSSYFLNTFGIVNFKNVAPGLIDDPFLNLYINPANIPSMDEQDLYVYLDFRGDRTEAPVAAGFRMPHYYADARSIYLPIMDPRWFYKARTEPEPIVSLGIITNPLNEITKKFFIGGTYQILYKEEKFYTLPYWIYYPNIYYDAMGIRTGAENSYYDFPVEDRFAGKDEMITDGHLFSAFTGYKLTDKLNIGLSLNKVIHSREGEYLRNYNDEYGSTSNYESENTNSQSRMQDYDHLDLSAGINYQITSKLFLGIKAGLLNGEANQNYNSGSGYFYQRNIPQVSNEWYHHLSNSSTVQNWKQDGKTSYLGFNFSQQLNEVSQLKAYYKYSSADIDISNNSFIRDSSRSSSRWYSSYDNSWSTYNGYSIANDIRTGAGEKTKISHELMFNFNWKLTDVVTVDMGFYSKSEDSETFIKEPANVTRVSSYSSEHTNHPEYDYNSYQSLLEDKVLEWKYSAGYSTIQIPVIFNLNFNDKWGMLIGINKIFNKWKITDQTVAYFFVRERNDNGEIKTETNFGERYTQPTQNFTDNMTKITTSFYVNLSKQFKVRLLLDPEFEHEFRIAQWWLSFEAKI